MRLLLSWDRSARSARDSFSMNEQRGECMGVEHVGNDTIMLRRTESALRVEIVRF